MGFFELSLLDRCGQRQREHRDTTRLQASATVPFGSITTLDELTSKQSQP